MAWEEGGGGIDGNRTLGHFISFCLMSVKHSQRYQADYLEVWKELRLVWFSLLHVKQNQIRYVPGFCVQKIFFKLLDSISSGRGPSIYKNVNL